MNRDLALGIAFFALMGVGGAFLVWLNWRKISVDELRDDQRSKVALLARHVAVARTRLEEARAESKPERRTELAKLAADAFSAAIKIDDQEALYWSGRAEACLLLGDKASARRDLDRAKQLQPKGDWSALEKELAP